MSVVIFFVGVILWLFMHYIFQKSFEKGSGIQPSKFKIKKITVTLLPILTGLIIMIVDAEEHYNVIIITIIACGISSYIYNLFEIKENSDKNFEKLGSLLEKNNEYHKKILRNPAYTFKANEKFSKILQDESYEVTRHYYEKKEKLEARIGGKFPGPGPGPDSETIVDVDQEIAKLLFSIASKKSISALNQFNSGRIFMRKILYRDFWKKAVQYSNSYLSICDLSMYTDKEYTGKEDSEISRQEYYDWTERVKYEIDALKKGQIRIFDKIILFKSSEDCQDDTKNPIFNVVAKLWEDNVKELECLGIKSHCQSENGNSMIWKFSLEDFSYCLNDINGSGEISGRITSNDLGIFGDHLIGEEFKVNEDSITIGALKEDDMNEIKFLYRISLQKKLVEKIKEMAIKKMNCHCQSPEN